jgi:hypothetical protein
MFQEMVQSLLETKRRDVGELIQFGSAGADGAREATWTQSPTHPDYVRPTNTVADVPKQWVFQVKFHDIGLRGWAGAGAAVVADLKAELEKVTTKYKLTCHHYVLITNVPLTGASRIGTRDKVAKIAADWKKEIPCVEVWDAADLSRMLDNNPNVRTAYNELILPGDVLSALHRQLHFKADRRESSFRGYLQNLIDNESKARAEEAGDDDPLPLSKVFIDQTLQLDKKRIPECYREVVETWVTNSTFDEESSALIPDDLDQVSSAFPLLWGALEKVMLLAGPGYGKSTITQFLALYHAGRIIDPKCASILAKRLKLPPNWTAEDLDASCTMRFPFRVELRRYAKWRKTNADGSAPIGIASYIARQLIGGTVESTLNQDDIFALISSNPALLILDGLDEVPNKDDRDAMLKDFDAFLYRCSGENVDLQIVMSSRPQGYHGEFDRFQPLRWVINDLSQDDFYRYSADWLSERIKNQEERAEAEERIKRGMASEAVRRLATTLLQATVMLTIVRKKSDIPEELHKLFEKYVDVVFQREKTKNDLIARYEPELKLLHEMVGYQIHETVARGEAGVMPEEKFKELVWNVWRLVRGDEQLQVVPNQEIQRIYELSTDRLVFLSGKGANQSDIDFVIQPYREYFAANYISNHMEADPEKVFMCLVERGAYWQQVLRFYAAIAKPAQQLSWAYGAALPPSGLDGLDALIKGLQTRRAVLFALPEFVRFQFEQLRKTISGCLPENEWWTWLGQEWVIPILGGLRTGDAWRELWKTFKRTADHSFGSKLFALWLFPRVIPSNAPEFQDFVELVSAALQDDKLAKRAIEVILFHEIPVDLKLVAEKTLFEVLREFPYSRRLRHSAMTTQLVKRLPQPLAIRFLCTMQGRYHGMDDEASVWVSMDLPVELKQSEPLEIDTSNGLAIVISKPGWLNFSIQGQRRLSLSESPSSGGVYTTYIETLFAALLQPDDPALYKKAVVAMTLLPEAVSWPLRCESVLGPSPDQFNSVNDWLRYKEDIRWLFNKSQDLALLQNVASTFGATNGNHGNQWMVLLFPPSQWDILVSEGLLRAENVASLRARRWAQAVSLSKEFVELATVYQEYSPIPNAKFLIPFTKLMKIAVALHNRGELFESEVASEVLRSADVSSIDSKDVVEIIKTIKNPSKLPQTWAISVLNVALRLEGIDLRLLSAFWVAVNDGRDIPLWIQLMPEQAQWPRNISIITELLKLQDDAALDLGTQILSHCPDVSTDILSEINRLAASRLSESDLPDARRSALVRSLLRSKPTLEEVKLYSDLKSFRTIKGSYPRAEELIITRLNEMPQTFTKEEFPSLRGELKQLLSHKEDYPPEICAAALDALVQLDVVSCPPITEADWRISAEI